MNAQILMFEQDKQESISQVAYALRKVYDTTHRPKIFADYLVQLQSLANRVVQSEEAKTGDLTVFTEQQERLSLNGLGVVFQHQIH